MNKFLKILYLLVLVSYFVYVPLQAQAQDVEAQAAALQSDVEGGIALAESIFGGQHSAGCDLTYLGTYDDVHIVYNRTKDNVAGDVIGIDGSAKGTCFAEVVGNKKKGGVQRFRYETTIGDLDPTKASVVNPLDNRGSDKDKLAEKKASIQKLSSDIAPFYQIPQLVIWLREEFYSSEIFIKEAHTEGLVFYPYDSNTEGETLNAGSSYWIEIHLEEILISYDTTVPMTNKPMRVSYFDLVYQKPVLIPNVSTATSSYTLYQPKFAATGYQVDIKDIPLPFLPDLNLDLMYAFSQSGTMYINPIADSLVGEETDISVKKVGVGIKWKVGDNSYLHYHGEYMSIYLEDEALDNPTISLDAMNHASFLWKF